jgi:hypothetical protein
MTYASLVGYEPADLLHKWIFPTINQTKNLRVFYNTVVKKAYTAKGPHGDEVKSSTSPASATAM